MCIHITRTHCVPWGIPDYMDGWEMRSEEGEGANVDENRHWEAHWHFDESKRSSTEDNQ